MNNDSDCITRQESGHRLPRSLIAILAASFILKCTLLIPAHSIVPYNDSMDYVNAAQGLAKTGEYTFVRAPGYPFLLAAVFRTGRGFGFPMRPADRADSKLSGFDLARFVQVVISTLSAFLMYLMTRMFFDRRAAIATAAIFAFYPTLIGYSHYLWSETLFLLLMIWGTILATQATETRAATRALACGLILGLGALTRQIGLVLTVVIAVWVWIDVATDGRGLRRPLRIGTSDRHTATRLAVVILLGTVVTVLPWTARNFAYHGELVVISATGGSGLLFGATDNPIGEIHKLNDPDLRFDALRRDRVCGEIAREIIRAAPVAWVKRCVARNLPSLFQPAFDGVLAHFLRPRKGYGPAPSWLIRAVLVLLIASGATLALTAIIGAWISENRRFVLLITGLLVAFALSHLTILGVARHRLPLEVMAMPLSGFLLTRPCWSEVASRITPKRFAGIMVSLAVLAGLVCMSETHRVGTFWRGAAMVGTPD